MSKNFALLRKFDQEIELFQTSAQPTTPIVTIEDERRSIPEVKHQEPERKDAGPRKNLMKIRWPDVFKKKAKTLGPEIPQRVNQRSGLETIRYREEMKLVQRIFPVNSPGAPQLAMFSSLEGEADACSICARTSEILAARAEGPVCVVDANLRSPFLHRYFGVKNSRGLSEAICESGSTQDFAFRVSKSNLWLMPSGSASLQVSFAEASERVGSRMVELRTLFKYILINYPLSMGQILAHPSFSADGAVLIVEANSTRRETVREAMEEMQLAGTRVLGVILNNRTFPIPDAIYSKL